MTYYTAPEAARILGKARSTVEVWCRRLAVGRVGRYYLISEIDLEVLRRNIRKRPGRPAAESSS